MENILDYEEPKNNAPKSNFTDSFPYLFMIAFGIGAVSSIIRPFTLYNGLHLEGFTAYGILYAIIIYILSNTNLRTKKEEKGKFQMELSFFIKNTILWLGYSIGWVLFFGKIDLIVIEGLKLAVAWYMITTIIAWVYLFIKKRKQAKILNER